MLQPVILYLYVVSVQASTCKWMIEQPVGKASVRQGTACPFKMFELE